MLSNLIVLRALGHGNTSEVRQGQRGSSPALKDLQQQQPLKLHNVCILLCL